VTNRSPNSFKLTLKRKFLKYLLSRMTFDMWQFPQFEKCGVHVLPIGYNSPIPRAKELIKTRDSWNHEKPFRGIEFNLNSQLALVDELIAYAPELSKLPSFNEIAKSRIGLGYGEVEAQVLYAMIRLLKPARMIEVGSGVSTFFTLKALSANFDQGHQKAHFTAIEPYASSELYSVCQSFESKVELSIQKTLVERTNIDLFRSLGKNDLLFIDSSHTIRINGDVPFLYLEVLPELRSGAWIHVHDITFPYPTIPNNHPLFKNFLIWRETDFLHAFLMFNNRFEIKLCESYLHYKAPEKIKSLVDVYDPEKHFPSSIWLMVKG